MKVVENYCSPTPKGWSTISALSVVLMPIMQAGIKDAPNLTEPSKYWIGLAISIALAASHFFAQSRTIQPKVEAE